MARVFLRVCRALGAAALVCFLAGATARAADPPRPKVALVLSGGGAMGIAHVGVIQELEKLGIRPDFIVGTSMGSIVGGLYASGMSGADLQHAVETMQWDAIFDPSPPREGLTYREKQLQAAFPVKASVGVAGSGVRTPEALVSDANLLLELRRLVRVRAAVPTFDQLPIPFRAVATDIETGEKVVIDRGDLAGAMRASMSVPGVFAPYRLNGKLLVDGGMADNVPIDVARSMGADIVIVAATQTPLAPAEKIRGVADVLGQTVTMLILANERQQLATLKPGDVLIKVEVGTLTAADFKKGAAFVKLGHDAAQAQLEGLQRVASLGEPRPAVSIDRPPPRIDYVRVQNRSRLADEILLRRVEPLVGKPLDPDAINEALRDLYAMGVFSRVDYQIEEKDGRTGLVVDAVQRPGDANRLRPGITIAGTGGGHGEFDVSAEFRLTQLDRYGSEARFVGGLGVRKVFSAEYFKVLDSGQHWFVDPMVIAQQRPIVVYNSTGFRLADYKASYGLGSLAVGRQFGTFGEIRAGVESGAGKASLEEGLLIPRDIDIKVGDVFVTAGADTLDNPYFPSKGLKVRLNWSQGLTALGSSLDYQQLRGDGIFAAGSGRHAFVLSVGGGDTIQGRLPIDQLFDRSQSVISIPLYVGAMVVGGNTWARHGDANWDSLKVGGSVFLGADTLIGPVFIVLGAADHGRNAIYFFLGKPFG
jgi:NTE family protein